MWMKLAELNVIIADHGGHLLTEAQLHHARRKEEYGIVRQVLLIESYQCLG